MAQIDASSFSFDGTLTLSLKQGISENIKSKVDYVPERDFENGEYILIPQESFNVDCNFNGITRPSSRFIVAKIDEKNPFARTIRLTALTAFMNVVGKKAPIVGVVQQKDKKDNLTLVWRANKSPKMGINKAHTAGVLPLLVKDKGGYNVAVVTNPVKIIVIGYQSGLNLSYKEQENNKGHYDVEFVESGNKKIAVFNSVRQMQFTTAVATPEEVNIAKKVIAENQQLRSFLCEF